MSDATDLLAAKAAIMADQALLRAIVQGPASGPSSAVTLPNGAIIKTIARVASEITGGYAPLAGAEFTGAVIVDDHLTVGGSSAPSVPGVGSIRAVGMGAGVWAVSDSGGQASVGVYDKTSGHLGAYLYSGANYAGLATITNAGGFGAELLRINASGIGFFKTPAFPIDVNGSIMVSGGVRLGDAQFIYTEYNGATPMGTVRAGFQLDGAGQTLSAYTANVWRGGVDASGNWFPGADNGVSSGKSSARWTTIYLGSSPVVTSGRNTKSNIVYVRDWTPEDADPLKAMSAKLLRFGARMANKVVIFQQNDSIAAKGAKVFAALTTEQQAATSITAEGEKLARFHGGFIYEDVLAACEAEGIDAERQGFACSDPLLIDEEYSETTPQQVMADVPNTGFEVVIEDDQPIRKARTGTTPQKVFDQVQLKDEAGNLLTKVVQRPSDTLKDGQGNPLMVAVTVPDTHPVPRMVSVTVTKTRKIVDPGGAKTVALRYEEVWPFIIAAIAAGVTVDE